MYAILKKPENIIRAFEARSNPLKELVVPEFENLYIPIEKNYNLKVGDIWCEATSTWEIVPMPEQDTVPVELVAKPNQPINSKVAQMISDLQADMVIAGVIK
ncbi:hypothetical protein [Anaerovorax sp. IOR16]|uniref:hypothetical protein n=1 Tax=Anaerovorax sp. IOR16 TaxID=2773458 RepID=UPI0019D23AA7|nr:hypothetical protein [Anaerovorax sp. IOR16]